MADTVSMALAELVRKAEQNGDVDFLRDGVRVLSQALMEVEVSQHLGAERHERTAERSGQRNGYREREWDTRVGTIGLRVPRVRDGSYFPTLLEPRKRAERALVAVVQEAYVQGISTRRVDELVQALGLLQQGDDVPPDGGLQVGARDRAAGADPDAGAVDRVLPVALVVAALRRARRGGMGRPEHRQPAIAAGQQAAQQVRVPGVVAEREGGVPSELGPCPLGERRIDEGRGRDGDPLVGRLEAAA